MAKTVMKNERAFDSKNYWQNWFLYKLKNPTAKRITTNGYLFHRDNEILAIKEKLE